MSLDLDDRQRAMLQEMGVRVWLPSAELVQEAVRRSAPLTVAPRAVPPAVVSAPVLQGEDAPALRAAAASCSACGLCAGRKNSTLHIPDAPLQADWLVLGDPPDADEDRLGQPFAEQTGVLLDNMLKAVGVSRTGQGRQGAHLSNVVKCRPPVGRLPQAADLAQCAPFLLRELEIVQPKVILAMGRFAAQWALQEHPQDAALPLDKQRGRVYRYRGIPVVVSYHPNALLRTSANKAKAWADLCLAVDILES